MGCEYRVRLPAAGAYDFEQISRLVDPRFQILFIQPFAQPNGHRIEVASGKTAVSGETFAHNQLIARILEKRIIVHTQQTTNIDDGILFRRHGHPIGEGKHLFGDLSGRFVFVSRLTHLHKIGIFGIAGGINEKGDPVDLRVVTERPLTLFLNRQEIVTMMTIGDHPDLLAIGYLINQNMLKPDDPISGIDYDDELGVVIVRTDTETRFEEKMKKKVRTSGCAQGTVFGDVIDAFDDIKLDSSAVLKTSWLGRLTHQINTTPSLYLEAGAIHGCVLCEQDRPLVYMEDVGRHNAVDKVAGWMRATQTSGADKILYTTGRLTSEMVIKCALMGIPVLASRSGFTAWGVELARQVGLTLIGRMRGQRFQCLSGQERLVFDADPCSDEEDRKHRRKSAQ